MTKPISPNEAEAAAEALHTIPGGVIDAFNEAIVATLRDGWATFTQDDVVMRIEKRMECTRAEVFDNHWLDVEFYFRKNGWIVAYDGPGYCDSGKATFSFRRAR